MIFEIILFSFAGLIFSLLVTPYVGRYMKKIGKIGRDVHKKEQPEVPESGGIGFMFIYVIIIFLGILISPNSNASYRLGMIGLILIFVTILGLYDDFRELSAILKPGLLIIIALPVFLFREIGDEQIASTRPVIPFVGSTRLDIVYWGLAIFVIAIPSNASNMLDVMNGVMAGSGIMIGFTAFLATFIISLPTEAEFIVRFCSLSLVGVLTGFWWYNKYPAKVFAGDTGSLGVGAALGLIAVYGQLEFILVIALLVHIMNSFSILSSIKGLKERKDIKSRPVTVKDGLIFASRDPSAPITLVRLLVARKPLPEKEVIRLIMRLVFFSCILAIVTAFLIRMEVA